MDENYCIAWNCPDEVTPLTPENSMKVRRRGTAPDRSSSFNNQFLDESVVEIHVRCFNSAEYVRA